MGHNLAMPPSDSEANGTDRDVLTSLPRTRPARRSAKRDRPGRAGGAASSAPGGSPATGSPGTPSAPETAATVRATPKAVASRAKPKPAASRAKPKPAAPRAKAATTARARTAAPATTATVPAESAIPAAGYATEAPAHGHGPDPFAVVTTAVQAAGEIAQIGATFWGQAMRSAISRLPRP